MHRENKNFYLSEINQRLQNMSLFAICNKLLGLDKLAFSPNIYQIDHLPAICDDFCIIKVKLIRTSIDRHKLQTQKSTAIAQTSLTIFDSFNPVTITQLHTIMKSSKPTSCALDSISTSSARMS